MNLSSTSRVPGLGPLRSRVAKFKKRVEDNPEFCRKLYRDLTIRLLAFKYAYYIGEDSLISDRQYDIEEESWYVMGVALGELQEADTSPCVGFSFEHPLADQAIAEAHRLKLL